MQKKINLKGYDYENKMFGIKRLLANADGYCICLTNNDFGGRRCSFYKTKTKAATERQKS